MEIRGIRINVTTAYWEMVRHEKNTESAYKKINRLNADMEKITVAISEGNGDTRKLLKEQARIAAARVRWAEIFALRAEYERYANAVFDEVQKDHNQKP
jgi:hypothetical protein